MPPSKPNETPVPDDDLMSLDFTTPGAFCEVPPATSSPPASAPPSPPPAPPSKLAQARQLAAAGKPQDACRLLGAAVQEGADFGAEAEAAWGLLFELYQQTGQRDAFEKQALEFARRFEKSPPTWSGGAAAAAAATPGKMVSASLSGTLNARVEEPLKQVLKVCLKAPVRIDLARIADVDDRGCELLLTALEDCRKARAQCVLAGAGHLAGLLAPKARQGVRADEHVWLLLLHLYQCLGREAEFEEAAVGYAVTFELSPPSWDAARIGGCEN